jgi:hypothetical protein
MLLSHHTFHLVSINFEAVSMNFLVWFFIMSELILEKNTN